MGFTSCRHPEDPFTRRVREAYSANVVGAPRAGIEPLQTLAVRKRRVEPRGRLEAMLKGDPPDFPAVKSTAASDLSGVRSAAVDVDVGLNLSAKFLTALGVPAPGAELTLQLWKGASGFTFEVRKVTENQVDIASLGQALGGRQIARTPATEVFFTQDGTELLIITRTLSSPNFVVKATGTAGETVKVAVDGLADLFGKAHAGVSWNTERDDSVSFNGPTPVTFAFSAVPCAIDAASKVVFGLYARDLTFGVEASPQPASSGPVVDESGLLTFDDDPADG